LSFDRKFLVISELRNQPEPFFAFAFCCNAVIKKNGFACCLGVSLGFLGYLGAVLLSRDFLAKADFIFSIYQAQLLAYFLEGWYILIFL
jgi:hypothetical protein